MLRRGRTKRLSPGLAASFAQEAREVLDGAKRAHAAGDLRLAAVGAVNACVRASDALCVAALGRHAVGEDHREAIALLGQLPDGRALASKLEQALHHKTQWSYGIDRIAKTELLKVLRAAEALVVEAERRS